MNPAKDRDRSRKDTEPVVFDNLESLAESMDAETFKRFCNAWRESHENNGLEWMNGHPPFYKGKKMDTDKFIEGYNLYFGERKINQEQFAKIAGISWPTLHKRLTELFTDGRISGDFFLDGQALVFDFSGMDEAQAGLVQRILKGRKGNDKGRDQG